jgi:hypothetical protein
MRDMIVANPDVTHDEYLLRYKSVEMDDVDYVEVCQCQTY